MAIRIFITGGTFDKEYNELNGQLYFKDTHMQDLLELGRCRLNTGIRTLMMIDSLEMTDEDRDLIVHQCQQCEEDQIVITHGTDTMSETAKVLAKKVKNKTIVLFGAMIPIKFPLPEYALYGSILEEKPSRSRPVCYAASWYVGRHIYGPGP